MRLAHVGAGDLVLDIGAGEGAITAELARRAGYVVAFEIDPRLAGRLLARFGPGSGVLVVEGDVFRHALPQLPFRVVSNVPFDSATRLLRLLLDDPRSLLERASLILQWEVALKRTRTRPGTLLAAAWAPWWELELIRRLPSDAFRPQPSVDAGIVVAARRACPLLPPADATAYRAYLRRSFDRGPRYAASARELRRIGVAARASAAELSAAEWIELFRFLRGRGRA